MGFRFRKSVKAGPLRINFSKSGVGYSIGGKGFRFTKKAGGGTRTTTSIPGTGISYVEENGKHKSTLDGKYSHKQNNTERDRNNMSKPKNQKTELILCLLLGWAGGHKFYNKKFGMGILYLLTFGLFFIGWFGDLIQLCIAYFGKSEKASLTKAHKVASYLIAFVFVALLGSCAAGTNSVADPTESTASQGSVTEDTHTETGVPTEESTVPVETTAPTDAPTETPTESIEDTTSTEAPTEPTETEKIETTYVLNTNSKKFHYESCSSVDDMNDSNKEYYTGTRDELIDMRYEPCGRCHP